MSRSEPPPGPDQVTVERSGPIALVTLCHVNRLNVITVSMWLEIRRLFIDLSADRTVRCIVLRGAAGNFAAGADIREFPRERADLAGVVHYHMDVIAPALKAVADCIHPVVAQIEGVCVGGGLELASQCDLRISAASARFGVPINRLGFPMAPEEMRGLLALAGRATTMEILLEGRIFEADQALAKGLLTRVVPDAALVSDVMATAQRIACGAPLAARLNKQIAARLCHHAGPLTDGEIATMFSYAEGADHHEGVSAYLQGRQPQFSGDDVVSNANLYAVLAQGFPAKPDAVAIQTPERDYSWNDIEQISARLAGLLCSLGLAAGERLAVQVEKSPEALMLYLATVRAGLVYLPLNTAYRAAEVDYFLRDAEPSLVVCSSQNESWMTDLAKAVGVPHVYTLDESGAGTLLAAAADQPVQFQTVSSQSDDLAAILYTSGTTGRSKGAMLTHRNLSSNARVLKDFWGWRSDDVLLHMLPIFHVHGLFVASHGALLAGAKMIWLPRFNLDQAMHYLPRSTVMMGVPTYYVRLLSDPRFTPELCRNMRLFISGSAPLLTETFIEFQVRSGHVILERYGMSETIMLTSNPYDASLGPRIGGTVGQPLPGVSVRVVNDENKPLQASQVGNVQVKGPNVFKGYWRMPEKTRDEFTADGWFKTGDVGHWGSPADEGVPTNYLSISGRSKDLIISGGFNVYPKEIELLIDQMPGVDESAIIGVPHPDFGEAVVAVVVVRAGAAVDGKQIMRDLKSSIANFKVPKRVHIIDQLPRNTMGKVQKNSLRNTYKSENW